MYNTLKVFEKNTSSVPFIHLIFFYELKTLNEIIKVYASNAPRLLIVVNNLDRKDLIKVGL